MVVHDMDVAYDFSEACLSKISLSLELYEATKSSMVSPYRDMVLRSSTRSFSQMFLSFLYDTNFPSGLVVVMHKSTWIKWWSENKCPCLIPLTMVDWVSKSIRSIVCCDRCVEKVTLLAKLNDSKKIIKEYGIWEVRFIYVDIEIPS